MSNFLSFLPPAFQNDETVVNIASLLDKEINSIDEITDKLSLYANLDGQKEDIIDELARLFHILPEEGYMFADTIEKKRELVRNSITRHRHKGTLFAVKEALKILDLKGDIFEWFQYGGQEFTFKIEAQLGGGINEDNIDILEMLLNEFKNVRSHLSSITFKIVSEGIYYNAIGALYGEILTVRPYVLTNLGVNQITRYASSSTLHEEIKIMPNGGNKTK